jgi:hypothetical protein
MSGGVEGDAREKRERWAGCEAGEMGGGSGPIGRGVRLGREDRAAELRGGCGDRSELGRGRRAGHAEPGRVREEGVDWALREKRKGERAGLRGKKRAKQRGRTGPGFWGKGWKAGYCYGFPFLF